jgi:NDP-sugar pyrophosphorylase family protein
LKDKLKINTPKNKEMSPDTVLVLNSYFLTEVDFKKLICRQSALLGASSYINAGIYVVNPSVISKIPDKKGSIL